MKKKLVLHWLVWFAWMLCAAVLHLFGNQAATLAVLSVSALLPLLSGIVTLVLSGKTTAELRLPQAGRQGEPVKGTLAVRRKGCLPGGRVSGTLCCKNRLTGEISDIRLECRTGWKSPAETPFSFSSSHCGAVDVSVSQLAVQDIFGFFLRRMPPAGKKTVLLLPECFDIDVRLANETAASPEGEEYASGKAGDDASETYAIREFLPGDSLRSIHWKLSKKLDRLMVREYGLPVSDRVLLLFFPAGSGALTAGQLHAMAEVFLSLLYSLAVRGVSPTVGWGGPQGLFLARAEREEDVQALLPLFFSGPACRETAEQETGVLENGAGISGFAHTVVVGTSVPQALSGGENVTLLSPAGGAAVFSEYGYRQELAGLEI